MNDRARMSSFRARQIDQALLICVWPSCKGARRPTSCARSAADAAREAERHHHDLLDREALLLHDKIPFLLRLILPENSFIPDPFTGNPQGLAQLGAPLFRVYIIPAEGQQFTKPHCGFWR